MLETNDFLPHRRHWWVLYDGRVASVGHSLVGGQVDWVNKKLAAKMARQMQDPLTIASGSVPEWCAALCRACGFLLPLDTRTLHFQTSGFGIARALTNLQVWVLFLLTLAWRRNTSDGCSMFKPSRCTLRDARVS